MRLYDQDKNDTTILGQYRRVRMHTPANSLQRPWARVIMKPLAEVGFSDSHGTWYACYLYVFNSRCANYPCLPRYVVDTSNCAVCNLQNVQLK